MDLLKKFLGRKKQERATPFCTAVIVAAGTASRMQGIDKILKKVGEECAETIIAAKNGDKEELVGEINDVFYHMMVMMNECGVTMEDVCKEMDIRAQKIGNLKKFHVSDHNT